MKTCGTCKTNKSLEEFSKNKAKADGHQNRCKVCTKESSKVYFQANKPAYNARRTAQRTKLIKEMQELKNVPCADCGVKYPYYVMDFDHLPEHVKIAQVGHLANRSRRRMLEEAAKCEVVCSNCHRERTWQRSSL